jgi:hypothetical protein
LLLQAERTPGPISAGGRNRIARERVCRGKTSRAVHHRQELRKTGEGEKEKAAKAAI